MKLSHSREHNTILKMIEEHWETSWIFLSQANFTPKDAEFPDIYIEGMRYNPLMRGNVSHTLPPTLVYPCQSADPGL